MAQEIIKVKAKHKTCKMLAEKHGVTTRTVTNAINGRSNTDKAKEIRKDAVEYYGGDAIMGELTNPIPTISRILADEFGVTTQTIRNALKNRTDSELSEKIRKAAVKLDKDPIHISKKKKQS